jgi:hypothetical protein
LNYKLPKEQNSIFPKSPPLSEILFLFCQPKVLIIPLFVTPGLDPGSQKRLKFSEKNIIPGTAPEASKNGKFFVKICFFPPNSKNSKSSFWRVFFLKMTNYSNAVFKVAQNQS